MAGLRRTALNLIPLEDRLAPAVAAYAGGTLNVTAATGDLIVVNLTPSNIPGYYRVQAGGIIFDSGADRPVRNLVVKGNPALGYGLLFGAGISLTNLTVNGASGVGPAVTTVILGADTRISGNFTFEGNAVGGDDVVFVGGAARIGGNLSLNLQGGNNLVDVGGGLIGGNFKVTAGAGNDTVNVAAVGAVNVGGDVRLNLGNGANGVNGLSPAGFVVGRNFTFTGGTGNDHVDFLTNTTRFVVGGSVNADLRGIIGAVVLPAEFWSSRTLLVGKNFTARGAIDVDLLGANSVGGNLIVSADPAGGSGLSIGLSTVLSPNTAQSSIAGAIKFTGGAGQDDVWLDNLAVGRSVNLDLRAGPTADINIGTTQNANVQIGGSLAITGSAAISAFNIMRTQISGALSVKTFAGDDRTWIDDSDIGGVALFDLGAGNDAVRVDIANVDPLGNPLPNRSRFQSSLTVYARDGNDAVSLSSPVAGTGVNVGGRIRLVGGAGADDLTLLAGNIYLQTRFEDFETGDNF